MMLDAEVKYEASDSVKFGIASGKMYLYGNASIKYQDINLTAYTIELDLDSSLAVAYGTVDTLGNETGLPVFKDRNGEYEMRRLKYNFQTKKAIIEHIVTEQGDGFIVGSRAKKLKIIFTVSKMPGIQHVIITTIPTFTLTLPRLRSYPGKR